MKRSAGIPANHAHHDRLLVTRLAADDVYPGEAEQAGALVERCSDCAGLADDIRALSAATAVTGAPRRTRDFSITAEQAQRLRGSAFKRFLRRLAGPGLAPARPLAGVTLSIGLVLAVVGAAMPSTGDSLVTRDAARMEMGGAEHQPMATSLPPGEPQPAAVEDRFAHYGSTDEAGSGALDGRSLSVARQDAADMREPLIYGGLGLALASLGVLLLIVGARRRLHDPLLR